jgi:hypothetical protein
MKRSLGVICAAMLISAFGASAAFATEGPFYKLGGTRLLKGEKAEIKAKAAKPFVLTDKAAGIKVTCNEQKAEKAHLSGSTGANGASSEEVLVFEK